MINSKKEWLKLLFFVAFPLVSICLSIYTCSMFPTKSAALITIVKIVLFLIPFLCMKNLKMLVVVYLIFVYFPALLNILHIFILKAEISPSSLMIMFSSNLDETKEFIEHFVSWKVIVTILVFIITGICFLKFSKKVRLNNKICDPKIYLPIFVIGYLCIAINNENYSNPLDKIIFSAYWYNVDKIRCEKVLSERANKSYGDIKSVINSSKKQTYVIVLGESVNRYHLSLYGYERKTTPNFDSYRSDLEIFTNVKSSYATTIDALKGVLTFDRDIAKGDIVSFLNKAGFKTFWISNQFAIEKSDGIFGTEARLTSGFFVFKNNYHHRGGRSSAYDEVLIDPFKNALNYDADKKVIFIHLLGSHIDYVKRYPKIFDKFTSPEMTKCSKEVAEYDNSILYTDYVLNKILNELRARKDEITAFIYFSDHGEDCRDCKESIHTHNEGIEFCYEIPMILWLSDEYQKIRPEFKKLLDCNKHYQTGVMIHSLLDLIGLRNEYIDLKKSLFSN